MRLIDDTVILKVSSKSDIKNLKTRLRTLKLSLLEKYQEQQKKNHWPDNHDIVTFSEKSEFLILLFHRTARKQDHIDPINQDFKILEYSHLAVRINKSAPIFPPR